MTFILLWTTKEDILETMGSKTTLDPTAVNCMDKKYIFQTIIFWFPQKTVSHTGLKQHKGGRVVLVNCHVTYLIFIGKANNYYIMSPLTRFSDPTAFWNKTYFNA